MPDDKKFVSLGQIVITRGANADLQNEDVLSALQRHSRGDWGDVDNEDWESNDEALKNGARLLSSYKSSNGVKFWIITEWDRSVSTILLPSEY